MIRGAGLLLGILCVVAPTAQAQTRSFPDHPIRVIVPFPAGGPTDIIARVVTQAMGERLGQPIVIENRGGAGGVIGTDVVAKAAADGYTLALSSAGALSISPSLQKMPYRSTQDLRPITLVARVPELLVVPEASPAKTLADLLALARRKPGALNYASTGPGGMPHLAAELLKASAKLDIVHVPFAGAAPAVTDLLGGRADMMFADIPVLLPHVRAGTLRALAIGSAGRFPTLAEVATFEEQGLPGVEAENWYGLVGPAKLPPDVLAKLHDAAVAAIQLDRVRDIMSAQGAALVGDAPESFAAFIDAQTVKWGEVVRIAGVKLD